MKLISLQCWIGFADQKGYKGHFLTVTQSKHTFLASRFECTLKKCDSGISSPYTIATKGTLQLHIPQMEHLKGTVSAVEKPFLYLTELLFLFS